MTPIRVSEPVTPFPRATLLATMLAGRYRPGQHRDHNGFLRHAFAASPWLGAIVLALIVLAGSIQQDSFTAQQQLAQAQEVEMPRVLTHGAAVRTTARSRRNDVVVAAFLGLLLGIIAALAWEPLASRRGA